MKTGIVVPSVQPRKILDPSQALHAGRPAGTAHQVSRSSSVVPGQPSSGQFHSGRSNSDKYPSSSDSIALQAWTSPSLTFSTEAID